MITSIVVVSELYSKQPPTLLIGSISPGHSETDVTTAPLVADNRVVTKARFCLLVYFNSVKMNLLFQLLSQFESGFL